MAIITLSNLTKDFGSNRGVFDISFSVEKGEAYGFLGPNGAGKTTAIRHILGFLRPDSGIAQVNNLNTWEHKSEILQKLGYLPGEVALPLNLTAKQFIAMMKNLRKVKDDAYINSLIERFLLDTGGKLNRMSLGMKRKLAIVIAFMHDPKVLVLDEPTSGLDPLMQSIFLEFIQSEKKRGKTILLSSHIISEVEATCDKISLIKGGRLISSFVTSDIVKTLKKTYRLGFFERDNFEHFCKKVKEDNVIDIHSVKTRNLQIVVKLHKEHINHLINLLTNFNVRFFTEIKFNLENYFMKFYDRS